MRRSPTSAAVVAVLVLTGAGLATLPATASGASAGNAGRADDRVAAPRNAVMSVSTDGGLGEYDSGGVGVSVTARNEASISSDGRFVAFESTAETLVPGDANGRASVFVRDRDTDHDNILDEAGQVTTVLVSVGTDGRQEHGARSVAPSISADGRYVAFESTEALAPEDTNGAYDVYVRDRDTDHDGIYDEPDAVATTRMSTGTGGQQGDNASLEPSISPNGRYVVFSSIATTLSPLDPDNGQDIYLRDRDVDHDGIYDEPGAVRTTLMSLLANGTHQQSTSEMPSISANGRYVVWNTLSQAFDPTDTNHAMDIYVRDRDADHDGRWDETTQPGAVTTRRLTRGLAGAVPDQESQEASITPSGRFVTFSSQASNLVANDTNGVRDVFVIDRDTDRDGVLDEGGATRTTRISVGGNGRQADDKSNGPSISSDGRIIVFESYASTIAPQSGLSGIYLRDRDTDGDGIFDERGAVGTATLSLSLTNGPADGSSFAPVISANRRWVAFSSLAENLVARRFDNHHGDVFVRGRLG